MNAIITMSGDEPVVASDVIAEGVGYEHKPVIRLVRDNQQDLEEFGRVRFQNAPFDTEGGTQSRTIALLSEPQATLLLTYMRNNDRVREFKKRLVKAFFEMRQELERRRAGESLPVNGTPAAETDDATRPLTSRERQSAYRARKKKSAGLALTPAESESLRLLERRRKAAWRAAKRAAAETETGCGTEGGPSGRPAGSPLSGVRALLTDYSYRREASDALNALVMALPPGTKLPPVDLEKVAEGLFLEALKGCELRVSFDRVDGRPDCRLVLGSQLLQEMRERQAVVAINDARGLCGVIGATDLDGMRLDVVRQVVQAGIQRILRDGKR